MPPFDNIGFPMHRSDMSRFGDQLRMFIVVSVQQRGLLCSLFRFSTIYLAKVNTS
jgi:hypothetical protein